MKKIELSRSRTRGRFIARVGMVLVLLISAGYFAISVFGNSGASESGSDQAVGGSLSLVHQSDSVVGDSADFSGGTSASSQSYASPRQMEELVPRNTEGAEPFKQDETLEYVEHPVRPGESLSSIARRYNRSVSTVVSANLEILRARNYLPKDATLRIPNRDGIVTRLKSGQTLWDLMQSYNVDYRKIVSFNGLESPSRVHTGQELFIPDAQPLNRYRLRPSTQFRKGFIWPLAPGKRRVTSGFGQRFHPKLKREIFHRGIDIGASRGTAIFAAKAGKVTYASRYGDYGKTVVIEHNDETNTLYAHLNRSVVNRGQFVEQGQPIAFMGNTGLTTGVNLHFEVRENNEVFDPMNYLPGQ